MSHGTHVHYGIYTPAVLCNQHFGCKKDTMHSCKMYPEEM